MAEVTTLFFDVGGVLLTNAWDHAERRRAADHFHLDWEDFEARHEEVVAAFETRQMTLAEYLYQTVFHYPRPFTKDDFRKFMFAQSQACRRALRVAEELACTKRYLMGTINNESLELNLHRIRQFGLCNFFSVFCSSCFLGVRKPGRAIYSLALDITGRNGSECIYIDDRPENLECPRALGMRVIQYESPAQLREELGRCGVGIGTG